MKKYSVVISEQREYLVEATSEEEASEKMLNGEWIKELDMSCNDIEIVDVEEIDDDDEEEHE